jgi:branched-chain amino acid transport system substrate-binding protein
MERRQLLKGALAGGFVAAAGRRARAADTPGVSATELKIGSTNALSGPASAYGVIARTEAAYFQMVNDQGGIAGRKINFIYYDDGYSPPRTVEMVRKLVEQDNVDFLFSTLGTPTNSAIVGYCNQNKVPHLFLATGADKWGDYKHYPWTVGFNPSYRTESEIYAKYILKQKAEAKVALIYQNDDFGKDYLIGLKRGFGDDFDKRVVRSVTYEVTDPTIDSQVVSLQGSGADTLVTAATPKFAAQVIRKVADIGWKPLHIMTNVSVSVGAVLKPAGVENAVGMVSGGWQKDPTDKRWDDDPGMKTWRTFLAKYMPSADSSDLSIVDGYARAFTIMQVLHQCDGDFSRESVLHQALSLKDLDVPVLYPGLKVATSETNHQPIHQLQMIRFNGHNFEPFGDVIQGSASNA